MATEAIRRPRSGQHAGPVARLSTETKHSLKTTEFWAMVALIVGILIASAIIGDGDSGTGSGENAGDPFPAARAWLYVAIVGSAYMVSRGLAKAGSRDPYWSDLSEIRGDDDRS